MRTTHDQAGSDWLDDKEEVVSLLLSWLQSDPGTLKWSVLVSDSDAMENFREVIEVTEYFFLVQFEFNLNIINIIELDLLYAVCYDADAVCKFAYVEHADKCPTNQILIIFRVNKFDINLENVGPNEFKKIKMVHLFIYF